MTTTVDVIRRLLLGLVLLGAAGLGAELLLLHHYEDSWQLVPLFLIGVAFVVVVWVFVSPGTASIRALQVTMACFVIAGALGIALHYSGNLEFQVEVDPSQHGWALFLKSIQAKVPPALAPGAMAQLGLLGLVCAYRHPALSRAPDDPAHIKGA